MCILSNLHYVDLMGPLLDELSKFLSQSPKGVPDLPKFSHPSVSLTDSYYRRIAAVEFTLKADDGASPRLLPDADVVIVGVSRTGKTPLSVVLAQQYGLKVANVPLVLEVGAPPELKDCDPRRVFCLTINPSELRRIRTARLERSGAAKFQEATGATSKYADRSYLLQDLQNAKRVAEEGGYRVIDVTARAVEETASEVAEALYSYM